MIAGVAQRATLKAGLANLLTSSPSQPCASMLCSDKSSLEPMRICRNMNRKAHSLMSFACNVRFLFWGPRRIERAHETRW
ncbi:hypothetical protein I7I48_12180 [Histoplasma ohiense]|nr:hypothetical protein I7I48_12180 [Histoplasma ohiense (nom. inval.)]